ncbi:MAG: hypothetical protein GY754_35630 [bacterium]|nr:hypothetical protein [bacterium]
MNIFDNIISEVRSYITLKEKTGETKVLDLSQTEPLPQYDKKDIVFKNDMALELGGPATESVSLLLSTRDCSLVNNNRVILIGKDIPETGEKSLPFGMLILAGIEDCNEENYFDRYQEMELAPYDIRVKGYMMKAAAQHLGLWSRISKEAIEKGFSFSVLAHLLMEQLRKIDYIKSVEIIFTTSSVEDVRALKAIGERAEQYTGALRKMTEELSFDCPECDYQDICDEVGELRAMREKASRSKVKI